MMTRGKLFVFEGVDGVGKTTIAHALANCLKQNHIPCEYMAFPGRREGTLGHHVYELHHNRTDLDTHSINPVSIQALHIAAHIDAIERNILPSLAAGISIVLDRYWWSTLVYGEVKGANPASLQKLVEAELIHWADHKPDQIFLVIRNQSFNEENITRWERLVTAYLDLADKQKNETPVLRLRNDGTLQQALIPILSVVEKLLRTNLNPFDGDSNTPSQYTQSAVTQENTTLPKNEIAAKLPTFFSSLAPAVPTEVYEAYWKFAAERQKIFFQRFGGKSAPWTEDPILQEYKFTNAYRASDRVSQYLIRHVIYEGDQTPPELFFRIFLFKVFNKISTWKLLQKQLGKICYDSYNYSYYDNILTKAMQDGQTIFSAAYIMPTRSGKFSDIKKHRNYLKLIEKMMQEGLPERIANMKRMRDAFDLLKSYPLIGDFLAYQFVTDINYSNLTNFSEMEFVIPGPGALSGIQKCFQSTGGLNEAEIIRMIADRQEAEFDQRGIDFRTLWGRPLQLIDCQNLFCEVDKYARIAHPTIQGIGKRTQIKQKFHINANPSIDYWYPPKWEINDKVTEEKASRIGD